MSFTLASLFSNCSACGRAARAQYALTRQIRRNIIRSIRVRRRSINLCDLTTVSFMCVRIQRLKLITAGRQQAHTPTHLQQEWWQTGAVAASTLSRPSLSAWTECHSNPSLLSLHLSSLCNWSESRWERDTLIAWFIQGPFRIRLRFEKSVPSACCRKATQTAGLKAFGSNSISRCHSY